MSQIVFVANVKKKYISFYSVIVYLIKTNNI